MNYVQNLHQHSVYCDGKDTLREVVEEALLQKFQSIGFSSHSYMPFSKSKNMHPNCTEAYKAEIAALKAEYAGRIDIFCGLEMEILSPCDLSGYDYLIGSTHYLLIDGKYVGFDRDAATVANIIQTYFQGEGIRYAKAYYAQVARLPEYGNFDIIGHFDLIAKHCETHDFFDMDSKEYRFAAIEAMEALQGKIPYFEVNTGAIARGYRTTPYPVLSLMKEFKRLGFGAIISSDCHDKKYLDCHFDEAAALLRECGFREKYVLTQDGFISAQL